MYLKWHKIPRTKTAASEYAAPKHNTIVFRFKQTPYDRVRYENLPLETADKLRHAQTVETVEDPVVAIRNSLRYGQPRTDGKEKWRHTFKNHCPRCDENTTYTTLLPELTVCTNCNQHSPYMKTLYCSQCKTKRQHYPAEKNRTCIACGQSSSSGRHVPRH